MVQVTAVKCFVWQGVPYWRPTSQREEAPGKVAAEDKQHSGAKTP